MGAVSRGHWEKIFQYPEAFEKFLKAVNSAVENNVLEELHRKQEQIELERKEKEREAAELKEKIENLVPVKKKAASKTRSKKS
jgi:DNA-binding protein H-NS